MRTSPRIEPGVFGEHRERTQMRMVADMLRQVSGGLARSILPGQAPPANPVPSNVSSSGGGAAALPTAVLGDMLIGQAGGTWAKLPIGANGSFLQAGSVPQWVATSNISWTLPFNVGGTKSLFVDATDLTKKVTWDLSGATTATLSVLKWSPTAARTITLPNATTGLIHDSPASAMTIQSTATIVPLTIKQRTGADGSDLLQFKSSANALLALVSSAGVMISGNTFAVRDLASGNDALISADSYALGSIQLSFNRAFQAAPADVVGSFSQGVNTPLVSLRNQTAGDGAAVTMITTSNAGMYRVSVYPQCTTAGNGGDILDVKIFWTDNVGATNVQIITAFNLAATGRPGLAALQGDDICFYATNGSNIQYQRIVTKTGTPQYALDIRVEWLG